MLVKTTYQTAFVSEVTDLPSLTFLHNVQVVFQSFHLPVTMSQVGLNQDMKDKAKYGSQIGGTLARGEAVVGHCSAD